MSQVSICGRDSPLIRCRAAYVVACINKRVDDRQWGMGKGRPTIVGEGAKRGSVVLMSPAAVNKQLLPLSRLWPSESIWLPKQLLASPVIGVKRDRACDGGCWKVAGIAATGQLDLTAPNSRDIVHQTGVDQIHVTIAPVVNAQCSAAAS